jgi:DNA replication protein DnaC
MTSNELIKQLLLSYNKSDKEAFLSAAREYIEREKRMKHTQVVKELERALFNTSENRTTFSERRFKNEMPIPRDSEKGFPLLEIKHFTDSYENLIVDSTVKEQLDQIIREFKDSDILATYNLSFKKKILLCGKPGTGKTYNTVNYAVGIIEEKGENTFQKIHVGIVNKLIQEREKLGKKETIHDKNDEKKMNIFISLKFQFQKMEKVF